METFIRRQALLILLAFGLGALLGMGYDLIRPVRRRCGRFGKALTDTVFCLISASALFFFSMSAGNGRLGLWELTFALAGFLNYLYTVSDRVFAFFDRKMELSILKSGKIRDRIKETEKTAKKAFKKFLKCYIIKDKPEERCETDFH